MENKIFKLLNIKLNIICKLNKFGILDKYSIITARSVFEMLVNNQQKKKFHNNEN